MVTDLDFEEIDDLMGQMSDTQELAEAIAADVAKVSPKPVKRKAQKKVAPQKVDIEDDKPDIVIAPKAVVNQSAIKKEAQTEDIPAIKPARQIESKQAKPTISSVTKDEKSAADGMKVSVRVLTKYAEEPEEPIYKPNPRTGRFMDLVDPKNDMTIAKQGAKVAIPVATIVETVETRETTVEMIEDVPEVSTSDAPDRDRLERSGLDPDATVEEMMELSELEDGDEFLEEMMNNLGEDIEEDSEQNDIAENDPAADILSFPDRSDAFLSEVDIEKRPLGGSAVANSVMMADAKEEAANEAFINDEPSARQLGVPKISKKDQKRKDKDDGGQIKGMQMVSTPKKKSRAGQVLLYIALILLLAILGGALGALAYFSGLF